MRELVRQGKLSGQFDDARVEAAVAMIRDGWRPDPSPTWVTCVPSLRHPTLVPDLAQRIARKLNIPFVDCLVKARETEVQIRQQNSFHQCNNLDGAFEIAGPIPSGPTLLIDDIVNSGWTLTIASMLLKRAGSGLVFPFALASATKSDD